MMTNNDSFDNEVLADESDTPDFTDVSSNSSPELDNTALYTDIPIIKEERRKAAVLTSKKTAIIAVLTGLSYVLYMFVKFPIPFLFPSFLDIQFSELPALIGGYALGPVAGCIIIIAKCLLKLPFSQTAFVGELGDIILGIAIVLPASLIYKKNRTLKGAVYGLFIGMACCVAVSALLNRFLLIPLYVKLLFNGSWAPLIGATKKLFPNINQQNFYAYYIPLSVVPFNILRCAVSGGLTFLVYKRLSRLIKRITAEHAEKRKDGTKS